VPMQRFRKSSICSPSIAWVISSIVAVGTLAVLAYGFIQDRQPALLELKKTAAAVPYDDLTRKPEDHIGQIVSFRGKVIQVVPGEHDDKVVGLIIMTWSMLIIKLVCVSQEFWKTML
jgi:hypothetical protein